MTEGDQPIRELEGQPLLRVERNVDLTCEEPANQGGKTYGRHTTTSDWVPEGR